jgi:hypothetical protein
VTPTLRGNHPGLQLDYIVKTLFGSLLLAVSLVGSWGATTINPIHRFAYGASLGWVDWRSDTNHGAVIGEFVCSGNLWAANVGWMTLGGGVPTNGICYENQSAADFGVNHDGHGNLRGYAYGANIGWIHFEANGAPKVDLATGRLSGYAYSANCGWISLSNALAFVQSDTIAPGSAINGLPVAWVLTYFGTTTVDLGADPDGDGMSNKEEYLAGTDPTDANSRFHLTIQTVGGNQEVSFVAQSAVGSGYEGKSRHYTLESSMDPAGGSWTPVSGFIDVVGAGQTVRYTVPPPGAARAFYRASISLTSP